MTAANEWDGVPADLATGEVDGGVDEAGPAEPQPFYSSLDRFVKDQLLPSYRRQVEDRAGFTWCPDWWKHAEAIQRLDGIWRAWEFLRLDGATGMSVWFRDHADYHMGVLLSKEGPYRHCSEAHSDRLEDLPVNDPPPGLFDL